jgi:hypothetical protein
MSNNQQETETFNQDEPQSSQILKRNSSNEPSSEPLEENSVHNSQEDGQRNHNWQPPALFRTLTEQQRVEAHRKFEEQQSKPTRTVWHGLYRSYSKVSTSKMLENKSSVARDHLGKCEIRIMRRLADTMCLSFGKLQLNG